MGAWWAATVWMRDPRSQVWDQSRSDPNFQNSGIGRKLMEAVLVRDRERKFPGVRLLQSTFHNRSLPYIADYALKSAGQYQSCRKRRFGNGL
jgi:GNAT superfamily N-acetyltransferase